MSDSNSDTASSAGSIFEDASEPDTTSFKCLFCDQEWSRVPDMGKHCKTEHSFDLNETVQNLGPGLSIIHPEVVRALPDSDMKLTWSIRRRRTYGDQAGELLASRGKEGNRS